MLVALLAALAIFAQAAGAVVPEGSSGLAGDAQAPPDPTSDPFQPPQGDVVVDQASDRLVFQDRATGATTARVFGGAVAYLDPTGAWKPLDNTLHAAPTGGYANASGPVHLNFASSGEAKQLVELTEGDNAVSFGLNGAVASKATVAGDSITYPGALAGADLRYQVLDGRVKETLILDQAPNGDGSVVYDFPLELSGLTPRVNKDGSIELVDAKGAVDFTVPIGIAVDSASPVPGFASTSQVGVKLQGDAQSGWTIELQPDTDWLRSPERKYPVYVDPSYTWTAGSGQAGSGGDDANITNAAPTTNYNGAGQWTGTYYVDAVGTLFGYNLDSVAHYDLSWLAGRSVSAATWYGWVLGASSYPASYRIRPAASAWTESGVTWNTQPTVIAGYSVTGTATVASSWVNKSITSWVQNWAGGTWTNNGVLMDGNGGSTWLDFAADESSQLQRSYIQVTYNSYPTTPTMRQPAPNTSTKDTTPDLSAKVKDPDGGNVHGDFEIWSASTGGTLLYSGSGSTTSSGDRSTWTTPTLTNGTTYWWDVRSDDGSLQSAYTSRRSLKIDTTAPATPGISSSTYTSGTWSSATSGSFAFSNGGSSDVAGYFYDLDNQNPTANNTTSGSATVTASSGWHELDVRSYDVAGNLSPLASFAYGVTPGGVFGITPGTRTQKRVTFSADAPTTYDGFALQYRRADDQSWTTVPASAVTYQSSGLGISTWPVTLSGSPRRTSVNLIWDAATTLSSVNGPVQVQARYYISGTAQSVYSGPQSFILDTTAYGANYAAVGAGPGSVNPVTGNFALQAVDATAGSLGVQRVFNSRTPSASGLFGPGWVADLGTSDATLTDNGDTVTIMRSDGSTLSFSKNSAGTAYISGNDSVGDALTKPSSSRFQLLDREGNTTGFQIPTGGSVYVPFDVKTPATGLSATTISWQTSSGIEQPTTILAPAAAGVSCGVMHAGCRQLSFIYATTTTATGTLSSQWGDYANQLQKVKYKAWDTELGTPAFTSDVVAQYQYDSNARLRAAWDGRISPALKTTYSYDGNGEISTVAPPVANAWTFTYATISGDSNPGRLSTVQRTTATAGTATTTVIYQVPVSGAGAPYNLSSSEGARWGQRDNPTDATAIFPADEVPSSNPPSDYNRATVYYQDASGRLVNEVQPSPTSCSTDSSYCNITTTEFDSFGDVIRSLSAGNRQRALNTSSVDGPGDEALLASRFNTQSIYSSDGTELTDEFEPAHDVTQPSPNQDQIVTARRHTHYLYDQSAPTAANCPCHLATTVTEAAMPLDGSAEFDTRTTTYAYNIGTNNAGWTLRAPLLTSVDPAGLNLVTTTVYDATTGLSTERRLPAGSGGGDAHSTLFIYYTAGTNSQDASCGNKPEYALLLCKQQPAAQPGTAGMPNIPTSGYTSYNRFDLPLTVADTSATLTRTTTYTYDSGVRMHSQATTSTVGTTVPTITWNYSSTTGEQTTTTDGTRTITLSYAGDNTLSSYQDSDGNTSSFTYNINGLPASFFDGKVTQTVTYDTSIDPRGIATSISDPGAGTFDATRDADGNLLTQTYPGGLVASRTYDAAGTANRIEYAKSGTTWLRFDALQSVHGEQSGKSSTLSTTDYDYDAAGRLTSAQDSVGAAGCTTRLYGFDSDSNRTTATTYAAAPDSSCQTSVGTTQNRSYDSADRATLSGYSYDSLGNTTTIPAADTPAALTVTSTYFANTMVNTITQSGDTRTFALDPANRVRTWSDSVDGITRTNHYAVDSDSPMWTTTNTVGTAWTRNIDGFQGLSAIVTHPVSGSQTVKLQLTDLHGDIVATADPSGTTYDTPTLLTDEYGRSNALSTTAQYAYLGAFKRSQDTLTSTTLMGARLYNPAAGRFAQRDPVIGGSANTYEYTGGNPVNRTDLSGQRSTASFRWNCGIITCSMYFGVATTHRFWNFIVTAPAEVWAILGIAGFMYAYRVAFAAIAVSTIAAIMIAYALFEGATLISHTLIANHYHECLVFKGVRYFMIFGAWTHSGNTSYCPLG